MEPIDLNETVSKAACCGGGKLPGGKSSSSSMPVLVVLSEDVDIVSNTLTDACRLRNVTPLGAPAARVGACGVCT